MSDEIAEPEDLGDCYILSGEDSHLAGLLGEFRHGELNRHAKAAAGKKDK